MSGTYNFFCHDCHSEMNCDFMVSKLSKILALALDPASSVSLPKPSATTKLLPLASSRSNSPVKATLPFSARSNSQLISLCNIRSCHPSDEPTKPAEPFFHGIEQANATAISSRWANNMGKPL